MSAIVPETPVDPNPAGADPDDARPAKAPDFFATDHLHADLKGRSVRGGAATVFGQAASFTLNLASTAVLARLLTPTDFGLIAMVTAVTGFVSMFKDAGLSKATVQRVELNAAQVSTLFWLNLALSCVLMIALAVASPGVAWFYGEPRLTYITLALAGTFLLGGLTVQHQAILRRQMRFGALACIEVFSRAFGILMAIAAAACGARYWALVLLIVAASSANTVLVWYMCPWRPSLARRGSGVRSMVYFGAHLSASSVLAYLRRNVDNVLIGAIWSSGALGIYTKAYQLILLPITQINAPLNAVALPVLSRLQEDPDRFQRYFRKYISAIAVAGMPIVGICWAAADSLILTVLGPQWELCIPIFYALIPAAFMGTLNVATGAVLIPLGRADRLLRADVYQSAAFFAGFILGLPWGPVGVAMGLSIAYTVSQPAKFAYAFRRSPVSLRDIGRSTWRPFLASLLSVAATTWIGRCVLNEDTTPAVVLIFRCIIFGSCYAVAHIWLPGGSPMFADVVHELKPLEMLMSPRKLLGRCRHMIRHIAKRILLRNARGIQYLISHCAPLAGLCYGSIGRPFAREYQAVFSGWLRYYVDVEHPRTSSALLRRSTHRIEKGLTMQPLRTVFALEYIKETVDCYVQMTAQSDPNASSDLDELRWAHDVLSKYFATVDNHPVIDQARSTFQSVVCDRQGDGAGRVPRKVDCRPPAVEYEELLALAKRRHSVRWFLQRPVPRELIDQAIHLAGQSPSACNRQPFAFYVVDDPTTVKEVARVPWGAATFCHNIPVFIVLVGRYRSFAHESDRHLIYVDGGLAAMGFMYAAETLGLGTCCIAWPDFVAEERRMAELLGLESDERPVLCLALGYPDPESLVPFSQKKSLDQIRVYRTNGVEDSAMCCEGEDVC